jgi:hypothetical protein
MSTQSVEAVAVEPEACPAPHERLLVEAVRRTLIHEFGAARFDAWLGDDVVHAHTAAELAAAAVRALRPVLDLSDVERLARRLHDEGTFVPELVPNEDG